MISALISISVTLYQGWLRAQPSYDTSDDEGCIAVAALTASWSASGHNQITSAAALQIYLVVTASLIRHRFA
jgi:hypothetical protein